MRTTSAKDRALLLRQAQRLGCTGFHADSSGILRPCSSSDEFKRRMGNKPPRPKREMRGLGRIRRQWENLGERGIVSIDSLPNGGIVSGMMVKADITYQPRDNDPDVFSDIESARQRARQLGCIGVSRRISKTGRTVWMPCTNMSDFNRVTGSTSLGRRHQRESIRRIIREEIRQAQSRKRKVSVHEELNISTDDNQIETKTLGPNLRIKPQDGTVFQDVTGAIDGDADGFVFDNNILKRRPIIPVAAISNTGEVSRLSPQQQESFAGSRSNTDPLPMRGMDIRRSETLAKIKSSARSQISEPGDYFNSKTASEIIRAAIPTTPEELVDSLSQNPFSRANAQSNFSAIMKARPNWRAAERLRRMLLSEYGNSSKDNGLSQLISRFGIPTIIPTESLPSKPLFGAKKWNLISGMYDSRGFIGINESVITNQGLDAFVGMSDKRRMSILRHEIGHALSDMAAATDGKVFDRRMKLFIDDFLNEMSRYKRSSRKEKRFRKSYIGDLAKSLWGTRREFNSARKVSDYATFSRDEYFAETIDAIFDPDKTVSTNKVDSTAIRHAAETLGISISEMLELSGRRREIPSLFDVIDSNSVPSSGSRSTIKNKKDSQLIDLIAANPGLSLELPVQLLGDLSPETLDKARRDRENAARLFWLTSPESQKIAGAGGQEAIKNIFSLLDDDKKQLANPIAHLILGPSGSGKTSFIDSKKYGIPDRSSAMHIGIDAIKENLSGYNDGIGSAQLHAPARYAQKKAVEFAINQSVNVVVDDYGDISDIVSLLPDNSYTRRGHVMYVPEAELEARIAEREKTTGPVLGATFARLTNKNYVNNIKHQIMSGLFDEISIWDNSSRKGPRLVAGHNDYGLFKINDRQKFDKIFGDDSNIIEEMLTGIVGPGAKGITRESITTYRSFNDREFKRVRGHGNENKLTSEDVAEIPLYRVDLVGQSLSDDLDLSSNNMAFSNLDRVNGIGVKVSGTSLVGSSLKNAYLPALQANSQDEKLSTDLRFVDMSGANLTGSDFSKSNLSNANLFSSNLRGANLSGANLVGANLDNADLRGANLQDALFSSAQLVNAMTDETTLLPGGVSGTANMLSPFGRNDFLSLPSAIDDIPGDGDDLNGLIIGGTLATSNGDFDGINIPKRNLSRAYVADSRVSNSNLDGTYFWESEIVNTTFDSSSLVSSNFNNSQIGAVSLSSSDLRGSSFDNVALVGPFEINKSNASGARFRNISNGNMLIIAGSDFSNSDFSGTDLSKSISDENTNLNGAIFSSRKHLPKRFTGLPTLAIRKDSVHEELDIFDGVSLESLSDFMSSVINQRKYDMTFRGLSASEWVKYLSNADYAHIDYKNDLSKWNKKNTAIQKEIEVLKEFPLPDGSTINLFDYTDINGPDKLIDIITEKAKSNPDMFAKANPELLWKRAMGARHLNNMIDIERNRLADREQKIITISNTQKLIDAMFMNQKFITSDRNNNENVSAVDIVYEPKDTTNIVPSGSKSTTGSSDVPPDWDGVPDAIRERFESIFGKLGEQLLPELEDSLDEDDGDGFRFIRHKFVHTLFFPGTAEQYNKQLRAKQEQAARAVANKDWNGFVFLHERPYRLEAFMEIQDQLNDDEYWSLLSDIWTDSENIPEMREIWDEMLASPRAARLSMMRDDERIEYDDLPEIITIYQGHTDDRDDGWSWTTDPDIAAWFAGRFSDIEGSDPYVTTATVAKKDIHAFLTRRGRVKSLLTQRR